MTRKRFKKGHLVPHHTQANLMEKKWWGLWTCYLTPLPVLLQILILPAFGALDALFISSCCWGDPLPMHAVRRKHWPVEDGKDRKVPPHFPFYVHFGAWCFLYSLSADVASNRESLHLSMKQGPLVNAHAFISHSSCPTFFFAALTFLNKVSVLKNKQTLTTTWKMYSTLSIIEIEQK